MLTLLYISLIALILWSIAYLVRRIVHMFRGKSRCSCANTTCGNGCSDCTHRTSCKK